MNWLQLTGTLVSAIGLVLFYYLMILAKGSPQKLLGQDFKMPDVRMRYTPGVLYQTFEDAGEDGRPLMLRYWLHDFGLILCLTGVMLAVTANVAVRDSWAYIAMFILTLVRMLADMTEDFLLMRLLDRYPERKNGMAGFAGVVTTFKHALLIAWLGLLFLHLALAAFGLKIL